MGGRHARRHQPTTQGFSVYVALTNIPEGELLTGFAMRSDPNVVFDFNVLFDAPFLSVKFFLTTCTWAPKRV